jgi:hypothetical protein
MLVFGVLSPSGKTKNTNEDQTRLHILNGHRTGPTTAELLAFLYSIKILYSNTHFLWERL